MSLKSKRSKLDSGGAVAPYLTNGDASHHAALVEGSIVRIRLENFVTYNSVEIVPGPHLNVIIGPNGTGKSSIVSAICLGLAGKTSILNRTSQISGFIKYGCQSATIEIELHNPAGQNYVIRREITKENTSTFSLNNEKTTQKKIEELTSSLNIQIGNLCQFLPQEKVADFAKMSQQQLLESTEKAAGPPGMFEKHEKLKKARERGRKLELDLENISEHLEQEIQKNARLETDVKNYEERQRHTDKVKLLQMKLSYQIYEDKRREYVVSKTRKDELDKIVKEARSEHQPLKNKLEAAQKKVRTAEVDIKQKTNEVKEHAGNAAKKSKSIEDQADKAQEIKEEFKSKKDSDAKNKRKISDLNKQLQGLENDLENLPEQADIQPALDKCNIETRKVNQELTQIDCDKTRLNTEMNAARSEKQGYERDLGRIQDQANQRMTHLRHRDKDTHDAVLWLRANQHRFQAKVHEPMILTANMKDPNKAKYIESLVGWKDIRAFVCENKEDSQTFLREVRDGQKLRINSVNAPAEPLDHFMSTQRPLSNYSRFGFYSYLIDLVEAPDAILRYLCLMKNIHRIPVGNDKTYNSLDQITTACPELTLYYSTNHRFSNSRSKYGNKNLITNKSSVSPSNLLTAAVDTDRIQELRRQINEAQATYDELAQQKTNKTAKYKECEKAMEKLRKEKIDLAERKNQRRQLQTQIKTKKDSIARYESDSINIEAEKAKVNAKIHQVNLKRFSLLEELKEHTKKCFLVSMDKVRLSLFHAMAFTEAQTVEEEIREKSVNLKSLETELQSLKTELNRLREEARRLLAAAKVATNTKSSEELSPELKKAFETCPATVEQIEETITIEQAKAECTLQTDESVIKEFHDRKKTIVDLQNDAEKQKTARDRHQGEIEEIKTEWIGPLQELIDRINDNFSKFFKHMNCAGEVDLKKPDNSEDYESYGIRIKVMYRSNEKLRELNSWTQSGGERSVATVLYMMALQELTKCPFRCVDEINQGMDPINERKVFELIVATACRETNSQYFLLTPKLLPDLQFSARMSVLCVCNGPLMLNHTDWNIKKFLRRRSQLPD